jgi:BirA family biotin operon repressor/biotin-[acetyl-CoA-carboxylase] ligase
MANAGSSWTDPRLSGTRFRDIRWFDELDSTNRYLLERAAAGDPDGVVAVADVQTAGRGRLGRTWVAPREAALLVSALLRPNLAPERRHLVTLASALALLDALGDRPAQVKWPNDVVVGDRKLAGILAETDGSAIVVGMGVNVRPELLPDELAEIATAYDLDRAELLVAWLRAFDTRLASLDTVVADVSARSATLGRTVRVDLPAETIEGVARALTPEGYLVIDDRVVSVGDVVHLRAQ